MHLPFTTAQFFDVIRHYNEAVWPVQVVLTVLGLAAVGLVVSGQAWAARAICALLALLWAWSGFAYQLAFFSAINPAAYGFAVIFGLGAAAFLMRAIAIGDLRFRAGRNATTALGLALVVYGVVIYPVWSTVAGHAYPSLPTFGLPCPTTIVTVGLLTLARGTRRWLLLVAPVLWALVGTQAAFLLGVLPDLGLGVAGGVAAVIALRERAPRTGHAVAH